MGYAERMLAFEIAASTGLVHQQPTFVAQAVDPLLQLDYPINQRVLRRR